MMDNSGPQDSQILIPWQLNKQQFERVILWELMDYADRFLPLPQTRPFNTESQKPPSRDYILSFLVALIRQMDCCRIFFGFKWLCSFGCRHHRSELTDRFTVSSKLLRKTYQIIILIRLDTIEPIDEFRFTSCLSIILTSIH